MLNWIIAHPYNAIALGWVLVICLFLFLLWRRNGGRDSSPTLNDPEVDGITLCAGLMRDGLMKRLDMRPRFLAETHDPERDNLMAAQILADQSKVHETPGRPVRAAAPGEKGYREPIRAFRVSVGQFNILLRREGSVWVEETSANGVATPPYQVPEPWAELVASLAFEVGRLRS